MQRDMELIRKVLLAIEKAPELDRRSKYVIHQSAQLGLADCPTPDVIYQLILLIEAGLISGTSANDGPMITGLTWQGHEFLDDVRDDDTWTKTKERAKSVGSWSLGILTEIAKAEIKMRLGLH